MFMQVFKSTFIIAFLILTAIHCNAMLKAKGSIDAIYVYEDNTYKQELFVRQVNNQKIDFIYTVLDKSDNTSNTIEGIATGNTINDSEVDEDENGIAYIATKFTYHKDSCRISLRFEYENSGMTYVITNGFCEEDNSTPLNSIGVMKKTRGRLLLKN